MKHNIFLAEGEACAIGSPSSPTPTSICGDGLSCDSETLTCQRSKYKCLYNIQVGNQYCVRFATLIQ